MTDRHLVTWLLDLDVLKTHKFRGADRHDKLTLSPINFAFIGGTLEQRVELSLSDHLVHLKSTHIANIDRHLHLWPHVTRSHYDAADRHQVSNLLCSDLTHFLDRLFAELAVDYEHLVAPFKLQRNQRLTREVRCFGQSLVDSQLMILLDVKTSLLHQNVERCLVLLSEVDGGLRQLLIDNLREEVDVASCIF